VTAAPPKQPTKVLRVSEVTRYLKQLMEDDALLSLIQVQGEVTNLTKAASGWVYFSIKDSMSQLGCIISSRQAQALRDETSALENGVTVLLEGSISVYESRGVYQLTVNRMRIGGAGAARRRFEQLRGKLEAEGLFAPDRKRTPPAYPAKIALITAPQSQAYHDVTKGIESRWPRVTIILAAVGVQGEQAAGQIASAIDMVNRLTDAEVIILARGGGSPDELDAFNDERVARVIFASRVAVITGIGHTQDTTIADLVADVAATTPTGAAIAAVPDGRAMILQCNQFFRQIRRQVDRGLRARKSNLVRIEKDLERFSPQTRINVRRQRLDDVWTVLRKGIERDLKVRRTCLEAVQRQMDALNPTTVLGRGYALITDSVSGQVVASTSAATQGRRLKAHVKDGSFEVVVSK
jgi:exodeoxyribonuclease VII large subunit